MAEMDRVRNKLDELEMEGAIVLQTKEQDEAVRPQRGALEEEVERGSGRRTRSRQASVARITQASGLVRRSAGDVGGSGTQADALGQCEALKKCEVGGDQNELRKSEEMTQSPLTGQTLGQTARERRTMRSH